MKTENELGARPIIRPTAGAPMPFDMSARWNRGIVFNVADEGQGGNPPAEKTDAEKAAEAAAAAAADKTKNAPSADDAAKLLKEVMANKEKLASEKAAREAAEAIAKQFEGLDPAKVKELVAKQAEAEAAAVAAEQKRLADAGEFETLKTMMAEAHAAEKTAAQTALEEMKAANQAASDKIYNLTVGSAFASSGYITQNLVLSPLRTQQAFGPHFDFDPELDAVVGFNKPRGAKDRVKLVGADGKPLGFEDALKKLVETAPDKDTLIKSNLKAGAGSIESKHKAEDKKPVGLSGAAGIRAALEARAKKG